MKKGILIVGSLFCAFFLAACDGDDVSGDDGSEDDPIACPGVYDPVCGLAPQADEFQFKTFSNGCEAIREDVRVSFEEECLELEDQKPKAPSLVVVRNFKDGLPGSDTSVEVLDSVIEGDIATLELRHGGGCADHSFTLNIALPFLESQPLQTNASLTHHTEDTCEALVTTRVEFDLRPLRQVFRQEFQEASGEVLWGISAYIIFRPLSY